MEYHQPDPTWDIWYDSYEAFVEGCVIKGRFHSCVPEDVVKNYTVAEYIMAHSWYHYPMYDETMTTIVGIIEWVVKHKCKDLEIPLKIADEQGVLKERALQELISELNRKEPGKHLHFHLEWARQLRNTLSHPTGYGFAGGTIVHAVREGVNILNQLFLPESLLLSFLTEKQKMDAQTKLFSKGGWQLEYKGNNFLVEKCKVTKAIEAEGTWHYLLSAYPLYKNFTDSLSQHKYHPMHLLDVIDVKVKQHLLEAKLYTGERVILKPITHELHKVAYQQHSLEWQNADKIDRLTYKHSCEEDIELEESKMFYRYLYKTENNSKAVSPPDHPRD